MQKMSAVLFAIVMFTGLGSTAAYTPGMHIRVAQREGKIRFEFFQMDTTGQSLTEQARAHRVTVYVPGGHPTLWRIVTVEQAKAVARIDYGSLPDGFEQEVPANGSAPKLEVGRTYAVAAMGEGAGFAEFTVQGP